jgi:hypothetical protein
MLTNGARDARSDFALTRNPPGEPDVMSNGSSPASRLPDKVARIWDRLELRDRSMIACLEAIVRSVRMDGTASVDEIASHYIESQARTEQGIAVSVVPDLDVIRAQLVDSVLPRLAAAEVISLPGGGLDSPNAVIAIANPWLRLALLESGLIQLDAGAEHSTRLAERARVRGKSGSELALSQSDEWAQVWFATQRYSWTTLAIVPATPGESGLAAASALVAAGEMYAEGEVHLIDATGAAPHAVDIILASMSGSIAPGSQLVIALDNPLSNPAAIPIARQAGVALLGVRMGASLLDESRRTLDVVGRGYFIGSVAIRSAAR